MHAFSFQKSFIFLFFVSVYPFVYSPSHLWITIPKTNLLKTKQKTKILFQWNGNSCYCSLHVHKYFKQWKCTQLLDFIWSQHFYAWTLFEYALKALPHFKMLCALIVICRHLFFVIIPPLHSNENDKYFYYFFVSVGNKIFIPIENLLKWNIIRWHFISERAKFGVCPCPFKYASLKLKKKKTKKEKWWKENSKPKLKGKEMNEKNQHITYCDKPFIAERLNSFYFKFTAMKFISMFFIMCTETIANSMKYFRWVFLSLNIRKWTKRIKL